MKYVRTIKNVDVVVIQVLVEVMSIFIDIDNYRKLNCECTRGRRKASDSFTTASMT